jgi:hypothetical protein
MFSVLLRSMAVVVCSMQRVAVSNLRMVRGLFMMAFLRVLGSFAVMMGGLLVMVCCVFMMIVDFMMFH